MAAVRSATRFLHTVRNGALSMILLTPCGTGSGNSGREIEASIEAAGISDYRIINDDTGFWIVIRKSCYDRRE